MNAVLERSLAGPPPPRVRFGGVLLLALSFHLAAGASAARLRRPIVAARVPETEIHAMLQEPPPPLPPSPPEAPKPEKAPTPTAAPRAAAAAAPPAAAANVMTARDDGPVDMTGGMVVGSAETYGAGAVSAKATGGRFGTAAGSLGGSGGATAPPARAAGPDLSRPPRLADGVSWTCPFPAEADEKGIDDAVVGLGIEVAASGDVVEVTVERDPGTGFGRAAAACARAKRFSPGEDRDGRPIAGRSRVNVRFHR